jgi:hypothetical protein
MAGTHPLLDRIDAWNQRVLRRALGHLFRGGLSLLVVYGGLACLIQQFLYFFNYTQGGEAQASLYLGLGLLVGAAAFAGSVAVLLPGLRTALDPASLEDPDRARELLSRIQTAPTKTPVELTEGGRTPLPEFSLSLLGLEQLLLDAPAHYVDAWVCWKRRIRVDDELLAEAEQLIFTQPALTCRQADARATLLLLRLRVATLRPSVADADDVIHVSRRAFDIAA